MISAAEDFRAFIASRGFEPPARIEPGRFARFPTKDKRGDGAGSAMLFPDCKGGYVRDWRSGEEWSWQAKRDQPFTEAERHALHERIERAKQEANAEREREQKKTAARATEIWGKAQPAPEDHPYLIAKGVKSHGLRVYHGQLALNEMLLDGALIVPARTSSGEIVSTSFIAPSGEKRYLAGPKPSGAYFSLGKPSGTLCIVEGFATGASVHETTGHAVAIGFDAGSLEAVAKALRAKYPGAKIVLCGDNDESGTGQRAAEAAARAVGGLVALPNEAGQDWNDVHQAQGADAVRTGIEAARAPDATTASAAVPAAREKRAPGERKESDWAVIHRRVSDIEAKPICWLWPGRIARGKVAMIAGHPGLGKSQITTSLAAVVTNGGRWPVDRTPCERGSVVLLSAEDDVADTIRPRLEAAGADVKRVHIVEAVREGFDASGDEIKRQFNLKEDIRRLEVVLLEIGDAALVVIDPVSAYLGGTDSHNNADVRSLLAPLTDMAARAGVAIVCVSHLNKGGAGSGSDALLRVTGSLAFVAAARSAYIVAKDPEDEGRRLFLPAKNNVAADTGGLAFRIEPVNIGRGIETSRLIWDAEPVTGVSADELLRTPIDPEDRSEIDDASAWLRDALSAGSVDARELFRLGESQGFPKRTVQRARQRIGADTRRDGFGKGSKVVWFMPAEPAIGDNKPIDDSDKRLSPMEESVTYGAKNDDREPSGGDDEAEEVA